MESFKIKGEFIQLNQLIKAMAWCMNGSEANALITNGLIKVNGAVELRKRNKIRIGDKVNFQDQIVIVE